MEIERKIALNEEEFLIIREALAKSSKMSKKTNFFYETGTLITETYYITADDSFEVLIEKRVGDDLTEYEMRISHSARDEDRAEEVCYKVSDLLLSTCWGFIPDEFFERIEILEK